MKTPEQWAWDYFHDQRYLRLEDVIKSVQKEAWNEAIKTAVESAEIEERDYRKHPTEVSNYGQEVCSEHEGIYYGVDKNSILKLKL